MAINISGIVFELEVSTIWLFALHMATIQIHGLVILNPYLTDLP